MGLQDREYYRDGTANEFSLESLSVIVRIILVNIAVFVIELLFGQGDGRIIRTYFACSAETAANPLLWYQYLTAGFLHANVGHLFFNMFGLYMFGRELELHLSRKEFTWFYLLAIVVGNVTWSVCHALGLPNGGAVIGASGGVMAVVILFCLKFPMAEILLLLFRVPAWLVGTLYVVMNVAGASQIHGPGDNTAYDVHLAGAVFAAAYWAIGFRLSRLTDWGVFRRVGNWLRRQRGPRLRVRHAADEDAVTSYEDEADRILAKIHETGESSLTAKERKFLEEYSRRVRNRLK